jgi:hypothetical protein
MSLRHRTDTRGASVAAIFFTICGRDDPVGTYLSNVEAALAEYTVRRARLGSAPILSSPSSKTSFVLSKHSKEIIPGEDRGIPVPFYHSQRAFSQPHTAGVSPHQNWLYCSMTAPKSGKQSITMSVTNKPIAQNCTVAIRSGSTCVLLAKTIQASLF